MDYLNNGCTIIESAHEGPILSIDICDEKNLMISGGDDEKIKMWTFPKGEYIKFF